MRTYRQVSCLKKHERPAATPALSKRPACSFAIACVALLFLSFFGLSGVAAAQSVAARLIGTVSDPSGAVVSGAVVTTINNGTGKVQSARTGSLLLGLPASGSVTIDPSLAMQQIYSAYFLEDTLQLTPTLTIDAGIRYEHTSPWTERYNQLSYLTRTRLIRSRTGLVC